VDTARHDCAFYASTLLFPTNTLTTPTKSPGAFVLDMADPAHPVQTATLTTPAMLSPHESLNLNAKRGLLVADMGNPVTTVGWVDIYDVSQDCRHPMLKSSTPLGILGHEGTFSPDGNTFWVSSTGGHTITAPEVSNPQTAIPVTIGGHPYLVEVDEFARQVSSDPKMPVGAARIIDIADDAQPRVVSNIRLEANMPSNRGGDERNDPGASSSLQGYAAHYCAVPSRVEPGVVACSFILSGMRLFQLRVPVQHRC